MKLKWTNVTPNDGLGACTCDGCGQFTLIPQGYRFDAKDRNEVMLCEYVMICGTECLVNIEFYMCMGFALKRWDFEFDVAH